MTDDQYQDEEQDLRNRLWEASKTRSLAEAKFELAIFDYQTAKVAVDNFTSRKSLIERLNKVNAEYLNDRT